MAKGRAGNEPRFLFEMPGATVALKVVDFTLSERISVPFELTVSLACEDEVNFDDVVGKEALLTLLSDEGDRLCHGIVNRFMQTGIAGRFNLYQATAVPSLWFLSLEQDCRIFQNKKVDEIVTQILQEAGITSDRFDFRLQNKDKYPKREYCVQYRETDFNFVSRLLEEEGIFYFFEHSEKKHVLVFGDSTVAYQSVQGNPEVTFNPTGMVPVEESVHGFAFSQQVFSGKITRRDFNFEKPTLDLTSGGEDNSYKKLEVYDYPGRYLDKDRGTNLSKIRLEESKRFREKGEGQGNCGRFTPGFKFKLTDHERGSFNREYLLVEILHSGSQPQSLEERAGSGMGTAYSNDFVCIPSSVTFRPWRKTPKSIVEGVQTALVTGPDKEEIYTDKYGRVKVHFHWDRQGGHDEKSSCWIRVATRLAGGNYGMIFTPRIGQEVLVDFLEGDPDQPIITGLVYNADQMPPYTLPDEKTKSTIKTNSSVGGQGFNEIRFEDKKGEEQIFVHGEKDLDMRIKNDRREWVGNDRHLVAKRDKIEKVERDLHGKVEGEAFEEITKDRHLTVNGKEAIKVGGSRSVTVGGDVLEVFRANHKEETTQTYSVKGMSAKIEAMSGIELKCGASSIVLAPGGVWIMGPMLYLNSGSGPPVGPVAGQAVTPSLPIVAAVASNAAAGRDRVYDDAPTHKEPTEEEKQEKSWIEIELVDEEGNPVSGERYKVTLPDGKTVAKGTLNEKGVARIEGIDPGTCKITFPNLDKDAWEKA